VSSSRVSIPPRSLASQRRAARAANAGTSAILAGSRWFQRMPGGRCGSVHQMASSGVTMRALRHEAWASALLTAM
jgi:hypothetical protein